MANWKLKQRLSQLIAAEVESIGMGNCIEDSSERTALAYHRAVGRIEGLQRALQIADETEAEAA